jgi:hypothetical protein
MKFVLLVESEFNKQICHIKKTDVNKIALKYFE